MFFFVSSGIRKFDYFLNSFLYPLFVFPGIVYVVLNIYVFILLVLSFLNLSSSSRNDMQYSRFKTKVYLL